MLHRAFRYLAKASSVRAMWNWRALPLFLLLVAGGAEQALAQAVRTNPGFKANALFPNDDDSSNAVSLGFTANFFGTSYNTTYVNNNGNITFGFPLFSYTPQGLTASTLPIIAPFWADVDTSNPGSAVVTYGNDTVNGRTAFGVNYVNVGYFDFNVDKLNSFQLVLIDRSDMGAGNFDIEFNYDRILWETGDVSGGNNGFGGTSAAAGYSNGTGSAATSLEVAGSRTPGSFLDSNPNGLIHRTLNSTIPGRLVFFVRGGVVTCSYTIAPASQSFSISGGNGAVSVASSSGCAWTAVSNAPFITITGGATGSGSGAVNYSVATNATGSSRNGTINIAGQIFTVNQTSGSGSTTTMSIGPVTLDYYGGVGSASQSLPLRVSSSSGSVAWTATSAFLNGSSWLSISPSSGNASASQSSTINVTVNFASLSAGFYQGTVTVKDTNSGISFQALVRVTASTAQSRLLVSQSTFVFRAAATGPSPAAQALQVFNGGTGNLQWTIPSSSLSGASWLTFSQQAGISAAGSSSQTTLSVNSTGLAAGLYQVLVPVTASGAANNPQLITVSLLVVAAGTAPSALVSPHGMAFAAVQGGAAPLPQTVTISNGGAGGVNFTLAVSTLAGGPWLHISQGNGSTSLGPAGVQVTVDPSGLSAGIYHGTITATFSAGGAQAVDVLLVAAPFGTVLQREEPGAGAGCAPSAMDMVVSTLGSGVSLPVSFAQTLLAQVLDNCGGNVTNATVVGNLGTLNVVMQGVGGGLYSATWTPDAAGAVAAVFTATHATLGTVQRSFNLTAGAGPVVLPTMLPNGVVEGAGFTTLRPLAPGSIVSIFGTAFASGDTFASQVPLPPNLGGAGVKIGGADAPLYYAGTSQINAQMPLGVKPGESVSIVVTVNGKITAPQSYLIAPNQPGIFNGAVLDFQNNPGAGGQAVTAGNPARIGHDLIIYSGGLGLTDATVETGAASPAGKALLPVTVTIGGVPVVPDYAGLSPGFVGLYQVNVHLGANIPTGDNLDVVLTQNGITSNPNLPIRISIR